MNNDNMKDTSQRAADTAKSVHLSASAGSGKTRALKERHLALLRLLDRQGLSIDQAVAITFTDKAAAEIKERVLRGLDEAMLKKIIRGKQDLRISTIHSFCMNLLKRYPLEAGLPPDFGVLDARDQASKIQQAVENTLEESDRLPGPATLLREYAVDELINRVEYLLSIRSRLKRMEIDANGAEGLLNAVSAGMEAEVSKRELAGLINNAEWRISFQKMEKLLTPVNDEAGDCMAPEHLMIAEAKTADAAYRSAEALFSMYFTTEGAPRKKPKLAATFFKTKDRKDEYEKLYFEIQALLYRLKYGWLRTCAGRDTDGLLRLYLRAEELYQKSKLREGLLDFDDLEIAAYRLLRDTASPDILYWLDRKILHFLVDEFQDTSDIQWAILGKLTDEIFSGQGADKPHPPTLFVVGDEKQSIYRFREANYQLIRDVRIRMETYLPADSREVLTLDTNYRSAPAIIEVVNTVFSSLWGVAYQPSEPDRKGHQGSVKLIEVAPRTADGDQESLIEAKALAQEIQSLIDSHAIVYEKPENTWIERPALYGDCAILLQSRTRLKEYETALQAKNIPYRVVGGIGFYEEDEVQALMHVLFFLWNRHDKLALAAALTSRLFSLSDCDLFDLIDGDGNLFDAFRLKRPAESGLMQRWAGLAGLVPLSHLIHRIIRDTGAYVRFGRQNPQAIFNIDKLLDTAREFDRRGYTTLQDFVEWVKNIRRTDQRVATADMNLPGFQGSVSIMTVHKAKGLEFPIVFLPGMNQAARSLTIGPLALISETNNRMRVAIKSPDNPVYEELWKGDEGEQGELQREHERLLYVAMTRARDRLVMIGALGKGGKPIKQNTWLDCLHRTIPAFRNNGVDVPVRTAEYAHPEWNPEDLSAAPRNATQQQTPDLSRAHTMDMSAVMDRIAPIPASTSPEWKKATDFLEDEKESTVATLNQKAGSSPISPVLRGTVLHRCLEQLTTSGEYDPAGIVRDHPDLLTLTDNAMRQFLDDIRSVLETITTNKDCAWIFDRGGQAYSELPFLLQKENTIVSGIIDRVVIRENTGYVIDYKAMAVDTGEELETGKNHYRPQIALYCEAVKEIFRVEKVEGFLLFLDSNRLELTVG